MRFISSIREYRFIALHEQVETMPSGLPRLISPGYIVQFRPYDATDYERAIARQRLSWKGTVLSESHRPLDPIDDEHRISGFDTEVIKNPELRALVERRLLEDASCGHDYIQVEPQKTQPPYGKYDQHRKTQGKRTLEHAIRDITAAYEATGFDLDAAVAYEQANGNSPQVIAALEALKPVEAEEELIEA